MFGGPAPAYTGDQLVVDTRAGGYFIAGLAVAPSTDTYTFSATIGAGAAGQRQLALLVDSDEPNSYYYCDLNGNQTASATWGETYTTDGTTFMEAVSVNAQGPIENRTFEETMTHAPPMMTCTTTWPADQPQVIAAIPAAITQPVRLQLNIVGVELALSYFIQIHSD